MTFSSGGDFESGFSLGLKKFRDEALNLAKFDSPGIVRVRNYIPENGTAYIIMEFVRGTDLSKEITKNGRIPWQRVVKLFNPLIPELGKLHEQNLIHRDIKPGNIKVVPAEKDKPERLVLLDFGSARSFVSENVTGTYTAMVTPGYAPIEQYNAKGHQGPYTDVYGLCATMYHAITGEVPPVSTALVIGEEKLKSFREFGLNVPESVEKAIRHGMAIDSGRRTRNMKELYEELNAVFAGIKNRDDRTNGKTEAVQYAQTYNPVMNRTSAVPREGNGASPGFRQMAPGYQKSDASADPFQQRIRKPEKKESNKTLIAVILLLILAGVGFLLLRNQKLENQQKAAQTVTAAWTAIFATQTKQAEPTVTLTPTKTPKPPTATPTPAQLSLKVGDTLTFGRYEQDNNTSNGAEAIEWQVLAVENGRALVISRYALDTMLYHETNTSVTWETCTLRSWLNGEFYNSAFSSSERSRIQQVMLQNPNNPGWGTKGGNSTTDRIFLLSINEANKYFADEAARQCKATTYAKANGAYVSTDKGYSLWWLRSPGNNSYNAAYVYTTGVVNTNGNIVYSTSGVVRPAFWLNL